MNRYKLPLLLLVLAVVVSATVGLASGRTDAKTEASVSTGAALQNAFVSVFKRVSPSVVQIQTAEGLGSGIVFDTKGDIVTNDHVVGNATSFVVTTSTGRQLKGTLVGTFEQDDLAVIKVPAAGLTPAIFADSSKLRVGDLAMAIGNPLGLTSSVTQGIVSALGRQRPEGNGVTLVNAIQTSAAINPGNSGGALADIQGRVIGIPTLAAPDPQLGGAASGIGFAIPSNTVKDIAGQIVANGHVINSHRPYLGVQISDTGNGVYVGAITAGSPADKAGLKVGDVITAVNGKPTVTTDALASVLAGMKPGQTVAVTYHTQGGTKTDARITLGEFPVSNP